MRTFRLLAVSLVATCSVISTAASPQRGTPPPAPAAEKLPRGNIEHGRYLVEHVAMCIECHSRRDGNGVIVKGQEYLGGSIPFAPPWPRLLGSLIFAKAPPPRSGPGSLLAPLSERNSTSVLSSFPLSRNAEITRPIFRSIR